MVSNNISRIRRRKLEREAVMKDYHALASELGLELISVRDVCPEVFEHAVVVLRKARKLLPSGSDVAVSLASPVTGIFIMVKNASSSASQPDT